jgi:serine/threonine-protein kinase
MIEAVIGTTVGGYKIVSKVATGGMGTVYKAEHALIGKIAAVKVLKSELSHNTEIVNRFFNEAKATTSIKHGGIVEVFDFGYLESGDAYLIMEFLEGNTLASWLEARGQVTEGEAAMLMRSVCNALAVAHAKGIIHRDLKPDNIFMIPDPESALGERPKILDFGIAKLTEIGAATTATRTGAVMGTPTYMSPEQCKGAGVVDHRADIYSLGCILYELLCGKPPFTDMGAGEMIGAHLFMTPPRPKEHNPAISDETEALLIALLEKDPNKRPQTCKELAARLTEIAQHQLWITQGAPNGITSPELVPLGRPTPFPMSTPIPGRASAAKMPSPAPTGDRRSSPALALSATVASVDDKLGRADTAQPKPTTLSGAASQSYDVPRSRKGLAIIASAGALIVGGIVAFAVVSSSGGGDKPATLEPASSETSTTTPSTNTAKPAVPTIATPAEPTIATPTETNIATPAEPTVAGGSNTTSAGAGSNTTTTATSNTTGTPKKPPTAKKPPTTTTPKKPPTTTPKKPSLIETDI